MTGTRRRGTGSGVRFPHTPPGQPARPSPSRWRFLSAVDSRQGGGPTDAASRLHGRALVVALLALSVVTAGAAFGETIGGQVVTPVTGTVVRAGDVVEVCWTPLSDDVKEFELLLAVGGAQVRLTPMLERSTSTYWWRVPNLPAREARLRLRAGVDEEEIELAPGPCFSIEGDDTQPPSRVTFRGGEWWTSRSLAIYPQEIELPLPRARSSPGSEWARHELPSPRERDAALANARPVAAERLACLAPVEPAGACSLDRQPLAPPQRK